MPVRDREGRLSKGEPSSVPPDRKFRDAWVLDPEANVATVDMEAARAIFREKAVRVNRRKVAEMLPKLVNVELTNDASDRADLVAYRQQYQAMANDAAIDAAATPEELYALWDEANFGPWKEA